MGFLVQFDVCFFGIFPQRLVLHRRYRPQNMKAVPAIIVLKIKIHGKVNVKILENDTLTTFRDSRGFEGPQSRIVVFGIIGTVFYTVDRRGRKKLLHKHLVQQPFELTYEPELLVIGRIQ